MLLKINALQKQKEKNQKILKVLIECPIILRLSGELLASCSNLCNQKNYKRKNEITSIILITGTLYFNLPRPPIYIDRNSHYVIHLYSISRKSWRCNIRGN